jgi:16S rRNA (adenine1518-N6/adenine1519-N6)-dimethyltransferase
MRCLPLATLEPAGWKIVGNLPYNIASPLIWDVEQGTFAAAVFMVRSRSGSAQGRLGARTTAR